MIDFLLFLEKGTNDMGLKTGVMVAVMIVVFYMFLIRPQSQKAKKEAAYRDNLKKGDAVMTAQGIHATFVGRSGSYASVEIAPGKVAKVLIGTLQPTPEHK